MIQAFIMMGPANAPFTNPLVSVLPRALIGVLAPFMFKWLTKAFKGKEKLALFFTFGIMTIIHTVIVLTLLYGAIKTGRIIRNSGGYCGDDIEKVVFAIILELTSRNCISSLNWTSYLHTFRSGKEKRNHKLEEQDK